MNLIQHVQNQHEDLIPEEYTATRVVYDSINHTDHGTCMVCKKPVYEWNEKTARYNNLCGSKACREEVRRIALERHIRVYNKPTLLNDAEHQEKMLANRRISGKYRYSDGTMMTYTGKYEKETLEFMDKVLNIPSKDIQMPGPVLDYEFNGETHSWITDIYYIPANLVIEIKDGGDNPNKREMPIYRGKQYAKEDMITSLGKFNYLRLTNNNFEQLLQALAEIKYENMVHPEDPEMKYFINDSAKIFFKEEVGGIPPQSAANTWITPRLMSNSFDIAIGNTAYNKVLIRGANDSIVEIPKEDLPNYMDADTIDEAIVINRPIHITRNMTFSEALNAIFGHKFRSIDEAMLDPDCKYVSFKSLNLESEFIKTGIYRENQILSGEIRAFDNSTPIKGAVILSKTPDGVFIHTPNDYYLSSVVYNSVEEIPQNIIDTMDDLYKQFKERQRV
jgi:hypothetical protein